MLLALASSVTFIAVGLVVGVFGLYALTFLVLGLVEKNPLNEFVPPPPGDRPELTPYMEAMNEQAAAGDFMLQGTFRHAKGGTFKVLASIWMSPARNILVVVGGVKAERLNVRRTSLYSRLSGDRYLVTTDELGTCDLSGVYDRDLLLHADFDELLGLHCTRLAEPGVDSEPFVTAGLNAYNEIEALRARTLVSQGNARFVDPAETVWRYTLKGVLRLFIRTHFGAEQKRLAAQKNRINLRRPGSKPRITG